MSRQSLVKTKGFYIATRYFYVATGYFYVVTRFGQGREVLCHDKEFDVATKFPEVVSRRVMNLKLIYF